MGGAPELVWEEGSHQVEGVVVCQRVSRIYRGL